MAKSRQEERQTSSARRRAETHQSFERTVFRVPDGVGVVQLKKDTTRKLDFLNYEVGDGSGEAGPNPYADAGTMHYERTFFTHRGIGPGQNSYVCPAKTCGKRCPVCDYRAKLLKKGDNDTAKEFEPKERQLFAVVDTEDREKGVQLLEFSYHNLGKQIDKRVKLDPDGEYDNFADIEEGQTVVCGVESKSMGNGSPFACVEAIDFKRRKVQYDDDIKAEVPCLDDLLIVLPYKELQEIFLQTTDADDGDEDDDAPPAKATAASGKRSAAAGKPTADPDEDDEPAPPKKKKPPVAEDEEEPAPPKKKKPAPPDPDEDEGQITADSLGIVEGATVLHDEHGRCTVAKISKDGTLLTLEDENEEYQTKIPVADVSLPKAKPKAKPAPPDPDEDDEPTPPKAKGKAKPPADEDDEPTPAKGKAKATEPAQDEDWDDNWDDAPPPKAKGKK